MKKIEEYRDRDIFIYALRDPNTKEVYYVGMTKEPQTRYNCHIREAKYNPEKPKEKWIHELLSNNQKPIMDILEVCKFDGWEDRERYWIQFYKSHGANLTNISNGGFGSGDKKKRRM